MSKTCNHCGGTATHEGWAFPSGGSFPIASCDPCTLEIPGALNASLRRIA